MDGHHPEGPGDGHRRLLGHRARQLRQGGRRDDLPRYPPGNRGLEIDNTWIAPEAQRTAVNTEAKYLQLRHAFEVLGAWRVQLKTDERNARSRAAIARLGCTFEGILRRYQLRFDGFVRNTAMFSLLDSEWPAAKAALEAKLAR